MEIIMLVLIIPWVLAGGLAYWQLETHGSKLRKSDINLYQKLTSDPDSIKQLIQAVQTAKGEQEKELEDINEKEDEEEGDQIRIEELTKEIAESEAKLNLYQSIEKDGLSNYNWSLSNILWCGGIFLIVGIILHFITYKLIRYFSNKN